MSLLSLSTIRGELFTAITHMEGLVNLERDLLQGLNAYLTAERTRLDALEKFAQQVEGVIDSMGDVSNHLHHPVNAFQLVNRCLSNGIINICIKYLFSIFNFFQIHERLE